MDRRLFLKLTGFVAAASALETFPVSATELATAAAPAQAQNIPAVTTTVAPRIAIRERGEYRIAGMIQMDGSQAEIIGGGATQRISRGGASSDLVPFTTYATFDGPSLTPEITVRGGRVISLDVAPILLA